MMTPHTHLPHPLRGSLLALLCAVYLLTGLLDHDLWKNEDAIHLGIAWGLAHSSTLSEWLTPRLAGQPWTGAPLYHWTAAVLGNLFGGLLEFHNAARLATAAFGSILLLALGRAAGLMRISQPGQNTQFDAAAPLLAIGTVGLLIPIHEAQPAIAAITGHALVYWGLAKLPKSWHGGILIGLGLIITGLAGGRPTLVVLAPLALLILFSPWRKVYGLIGWLVAAVLTAIALGGFLWVRGTDTLPTMSGVFNAPHPFSGNHFELLVWFAWPVLPLAIWSLWLQRRQFNQVHIILPVLGSLSTLLIFLIYGEPRILPALPTLVPLTLLAASGAGRLRRGAANAFDWFGMMTFTLASGLVWLGGIAMMFGVPSQIQRNFAKLEPGFVAEWSTLAWGAAAALTILWVIIIFGTRRSPWRGVTHWSCGVVLMWGLIAALWMPWVDYGKSYRPVVRSLEKALPQNYGCIAGSDIGDAQRAVLDYHAGIRPKRGEASKNCNWLLIQDNPNSPPTPGTGWRKVWEGNRVGDKNERFYLFRR